MESILVVDASKLGSLKPAFFADISAFSQIIVGGSVTPDMRKHFRSLPVEYVTKAT
jgi:DeoR family deoxyribose operon repressor